MEQRRTLSIGPSVCASRVLEGGSRSTLRWRCAISAVCELSVTDSGLTCLVREEMRAPSSKRGAALGLGFFPLCAERMWQMWSYTGRVVSAGTTHTDSAVWAAVCFRGWPSEMRGGANRQQTPPTSLRGVPRDRVGDARPPSPPITLALRGGAGGHGSGTWHHPGPVGCPSGQSVGFPRRCSGYRRPRGDCELETLHHRAQGETGPRGPRNFTFSLFSKNVLGCSGFRT